jgi:hypothetical protein
MTDAWHYREETPRRPAHPPTVAVQTRPYPLSAATRPAGRWQGASYSQAEHLMRILPGVADEAVRAAASGELRLGYGPPPPRASRHEPSAGWAQTETQRAVPVPPAVSPRRRESWTGRLRRLLAG